MEKGASGSSGDITNRRIKKRDEIRKRNTIIKWFSSFIVTAVVVAAAISASANGATAAFTAIECVGNVLFYEVSVTDDNHTLTEGSLRVLIESPLDKRETSIQTGNTKGKFTTLLPNTEYTVSVMGSAGFGLYSLNKMKIKTGKTCAGRITSVTIRQSSGSDSQGTYYPRYQGDISLFYNDAKNEISSIYAEYAFLSYHAEGDTPSYTRHPVTAQEESFIIPDLPYTNGTLSVRLIAVLNTGETVVLDEASANPPFILFSSVYVYPVTADSITINIYPDSAIEAEYSATIFFDGMAVKTLPLISSAYNNSLTKQAVFDNLLPSTVYTVEVTAAYVNPYTSLPEAKSIYGQEVTTLAYSGGDILSAAIHRVEDEYDTMYECPVHVAYEDGQSLYLAVYAEYVFHYYEEGDFNPEYFRIEATSQDFFFTITDIPYSNGSLEVRLVAETASGEILLDQKTFFTPYIVNAFTYAQGYQNTVSVMVFPDFALQDNVLYTASLFDTSGLLIETLDVVIETSEYGEEIGYVLFENLMENTEYTLALNAAFLNPFTGKYETQTCSVQPVVTSMPSPN